MKYLYCFILIHLLSTAVVIGENCENRKTNVLPEWALGGFKRPKRVNPIISPNENTKFYCPIKQDSVDWESFSTKESDVEICMRENAMEVETHLPIMDSRDRRVKGKGMRV